MRPTARWNSWRIKLVRKKIDPKWKFWQQSLWITLSNRVMISGKTPLLLSFSKGTLSTSSHLVLLYWTDGRHIFAWDLQNSHQNNLEWLLVHSCKRKNMFFLFFITLGWTVPLSSVSNHWSIRGSNGDGSVSQWFNSCRTYGNFHRSGPSCCSGTPSRPGKLSAGRT